MLPLWLVLAARADSGDPSTIVAGEGVAGDRFGFSLTAGGLRGMAEDQVVVGAPGVDAHAGAVHVFTVSSGEEERLVSPDGASGDRFGQSVAVVGDVDGDGFDDLVVGAYADDDRGSNSGAAFLFYGAASSLALPADRLLASGGAEGDYLGVSVGGGDFDGDGFGDVLLGAYGDDPAGGWSGSATALHGGSGGVDLDTEALLSASDGVPNAEFGWALAGLGDLDGDGFDDAVVGARGDDEAGDHAGAVYLYQGSTSGLVGEQKLLASDGAIYDWYGQAVAGAGDVDGDGYRDLVVGAYGEDDAGSASGSVYLYFGSSTGAEVASEQKWSAPDGLSNDYLGSAVAGAGDVDGDGFAEVLVGAYGAGAEDSGAAYLLYGSATGVAAFFRIEPDPAEPGDTFGWSVAGIGDLDGDGDPELGVGAWQSANPGSATLVEGGCRMLAWYADSDGDGHGAGPIQWSCAAPVDHVEGGEDCDDADDDVHPGATEGAADGVDQDCDGLELCYADADGDGFTAGTVESAVLSCEGAGVRATASQPDCDDEDEGVHPGAEELPADLRDSDCDGRELCHEDGDGDGFGTDVLVLGDLACAEAGVSPSAEDCDDDSADTWPGAAELDSATGCLRDEDGDGFGAEHPPDPVEPGTDCDDRDGGISPAASEQPGDGIDQDCDGEDGAPEEGSPGEREGTGSPAGAGCGCGVGPGGLAGLWVLVVLVFSRRR